MKRFDDSLSPLDGSPHLPLDPDLEEKLADLLRQTQIPADSVPDLLRVCSTLCAWIDRRRQRQNGDTLVVGVSGAQGSGKTTFRRCAEILLREHFGLKVRGFSIDDLYLTRAERQDLARQVHPLFLTRGVPGTHDVRLGCDLIRDLRNAGPPSVIPIPSFDKSLDDRAPKEAWPVHRGPVDIVLFEGWCVGAEPQQASTLVEPVNVLEAIEDPDAVWRTRVNDHLRGPYRSLFEPIDELIFFAVPGFDQVRDWRWRQEQKLARDFPDAPGLMTREQIETFVLHYERLTCHMLETLPRTASVVCELDTDHRLTRIRARDQGSSRLT